MDMNLKQVPLALLALYGLKLLITGCNPSEASVVFALCGLIAVNDFMSRSKKVQEIKIHNDEEIAKIKGVVEKQNEVIARMAEELAKNKTAVESVKLATGMMRSVK